MREKSNYPHTEKSEQQPNRRDFLRNLFQTSATGIIINNTDKLLAQNRLEKNYEGLDEGLASEMKKIDKMPDEIKKSYASVKDKLKILLDLWNQKDKTKQSINEAFVQYEESEKSFESLRMRCGNLVADLRRQYRNKLPAIQQAAFDSWDTSKQAFLRQYSITGTKESIKTLEKISKFIK